MAVRDQSDRPVVLACLALVLAYPLFAVNVQVSYRQLAPLLGVIGARAATEGAIWLYALASVGFALNKEPRTLAGIGLRRLTWATVPVGLAGAVAMFIAGQGGDYLAYTVLRAPA